MDPCVPPPHWPPAVHGRHFAGHGRMPYGFMASTSSAFGADVPVAAMSEDAEALDDYSQNETEFLQYARPLIDKQRDAVRKAVAEQKDKPSMKEQDEQEFCSIMPPIESYMAVGAEDRAKSFFATVQLGDILICKIDKKIDSGLICLAIATDAGVRRDLTDTGAAVFCHFTNCSQNTSYTSEQSMNRGSEYEVEDLLSLVVQRVERDKFKVMTSMKGEHLPAAKKHFKLGPVDATDPDTMPVHYVRQHEAAIESQTYDSLLHSTPAFNNPAASLYMTRHLMKLHPPDDTLTLFKNRSLRSYQEKDCAPYLRKVQNKRWASEPLRLGIQALKERRVAESEQWLTKAILIDPQSVDAYIARGCLFANCDDYTKALADYDRALRIDASHRNARSYCSRTLVAFAESIIQDAKQAGSGVVPERAEKMLLKAIQIGPNNADAKTAYERHMSRPAPAFDPLPNLPAASSASQAVGPPAPSPSTSGTPAATTPFAASPHDYVSSTTHAAVVQQAIAAVTSLQPLPAEPPSPPSPPSPPLEEGEISESIKSIPLPALSYVPPMAGLVQICQLTAASSEPVRSRSSVSESSSSADRSLRSRSPVRRVSRSPIRLSNRSPIRRSRSPVRSPIRRTRSPIRKRSPIRSARSPIRRTPSPDAKRRRSPSHRSRSPLRSAPAVAPPTTPPLCDRQRDRPPGLTYRPPATVGPRFTDPDSRFRPTRPQFADQQYGRMPGPAGDSRRAYSDRVPHQRHSSRDYRREDRRDDHHQQQRRHHRGARPMSPRSQARFDQAEQEDLDAIRNAFI